VRPHKLLLINCRMNPLLYLIHKFRASIHFAKQFPI
jgi:hypothetical protein